LKAGHGTNLTTMIHQALDRDLLMIGDRDPIQLRQGIGTGANDHIPIFEQLATGVVVEGRFGHVGQGNNNFDLGDINDVVVLCVEPSEVVQSYEWGKLRNTIS
jgi:hypothetical protein